MEGGWVRDVENEPRLEGFSPIIERCDGNTDTKEKYQPMIPASDFLKDTHRIHQQKYIKNSLHTYVQTGKHKYRWDKPKQQDDWIIMERNKKKQQQQQLGEEKDQQHQRHQTYR